MPVVHPLCSLVPCQVAELFLMGVSRGVLFASPSPAARFVHARTLMPPPHRVAALGHTGGVPGQEAQAGPGGGVQERRNPFAGLSTPFRPPCICTMVPVAALGDAPYASSIYIDGKYCTVL